MSTKSKKKRVAATEPIADDVKVQPTETPAAEAQTATTNQDFSRVLSFQDRMAEIQLIIEGAQRRKEVICKQAEEKVQALQKELDEAIKPLDAIITAYAADLEKMTQIVQQQQKAAVEEKSASSSEKKDA